MYSSRYICTMYKFTRMNRRGGSNKPTTTSQGGRCRAVAHLPTSIIGWVIGHKGCNARMLKQQTGTELWVDVPGQVCQKVATWYGPSPALLLQQQSNQYHQLCHADSEHVRHTTDLARRAMAPDCFCGDRMYEFYLGAYNIHTTLFVVPTCTNKVYLVFFDSKYGVVRSPSIFSAAVVVAVCHHRIAGRAGGGGRHGSRQRLRQDGSHLHRQGPG